MRDLPDGSTLAALADEWDEERIAGLSHDEQASTRAMIARCRAIAAREAKASAGALAAIVGALRRLYGSGDPDAQIRQLARDIRDGRFDPPAPQTGEVRELLWALTRQKLRESNPGFLAAHGLE